MALPIGPYQGQDLRNYEAGNRFLPREFYSLNSPIQANTIGNTGGITDTQAAGSYMGYPSYEAWLLAQGGGGGNGGGNGGVDEIEEDTFTMGMSPGAMGGKLPGFGNWAKRTLGGLGHAYSQLPTPGNLIMKGIRHWKGKRDTRRAEEQQAKMDLVSQQSQANAIAAGGGQPQSGITASTTAAQAAGMGGGSRQATSAGSTNSGRTDGGWGWAQGGRIGYGFGDLVKGWFSGGPESETNPTLFGAQNSLLNKASIAQLKNAIGIYQASGELDQEQQLDYELKLKQLEALIAGSKGKAEGGRIGYFDGGIARLL